MFREVITIEDYLKEIEKLKVSRKKAQDRKDFVNSKISTQIDRHNAYVTALQDKSQRNDKICENKLAQIDRMIKEYEETIKVKASIEKDIADKIARANAKEIFGCQRKQVEIAKKESKN